VRSAGPAARLRSVVLGAALGGSVGVPAGMLQDKVAALLPPEQQERRWRQLQQTEAIIAGTGERRPSYCAIADLTLAACISHPAPTRSCSGA
jgi:hypothetical protein